MKKRCLISLWHIMIQERDIHCKRRDLECDNCSIKRLCVDLDASYEWMEKNYDKD